MPQTRHRNTSFPDEFNPDGAPQSNFSRRKITLRYAGWRRHPMFGVCDLPQVPFPLTALRRE
jgi:hypothetical protein